MGGLSIDSLNTGATLGREAASAPQPDKRFEWTRCSGDPCGRRFILDLMMASATRQSTYEFDIIEHAPLHLRLFDWAPSPFCMKVRTILNYKGVQNERIAVLGPSLMELLRRSNVRKVPALDVDGRMIIDSTDIAHEIERLFPEPEILPADPRLQGLSHAIEDWSDEALYFLGLYFQWVEPRGKPMVRKAFGGGPLGIGERLFYQRRIAAQLRGQGTGRLGPTWSASEPCARLRAELHDA